MFALAAIGINVGLVGAAEPRADAHGAGHAVHLAAQQAAKNDLRNKAAALGASLVTIDEDTGEAIPLQAKTKVKLVGRAYKSVD